MKIRDSVGKLDISFSREEEQIIRTKVFQRLCRIKQLGSTFYVYPMATHTRFAHSLGVYSMTKQIMREIEEDDREEYRFTFDKDEKRLIAVTALLHDIGHLPFGHTLEDDLELIPKHDSQEQYEQFLSGEIQDIIGKDTTKIIISTLTKEPRDLDKPYQSEIIKNTISADLLDYLRRDAFGTGLEINWDNRILEYLKIMTWSFTNKRHLCIEIGEGGVKDESVISEARRLLEGRYFLAERVYYYHTKLAADAMIGKALSEAKLPDTVLHDKGDDEFLLYLRDKSRNPITSKLILDFWERRLFRTAYMIDEESIRTCLGKFPTEFALNFRTRTQASDAERKLANENSFTYDDIIVLCLDPEMNLKAANALMRDKHGDIMRAQSLPGFKEINDQHRNLWRLYVFARPGVEEAVEAKCTKFFGCPNKWNVAQRIARGLYY